MVASATGHDRAALRLAKVSQISAWVGTPITFIEGGGAFVTASHFLASAANKAAADPVSVAFAGPSFDPNQAGTANLQRTLAAVGQVGVAKVATAAALGVLGIGARAAAPFVKRAVGPSLRKFAARFGPALGEDTIPAGRRLMVRPGAINAPLDYTKPGETFVRVASRPEKLRFSFKAPGGAQAETYAFPEEQFTKFNNNPYLMKYFGDIPGSTPTMYGRFTPPAGTPIKRGIVPGGEFGGAGGAQEVYFPDEF